MQQTYTVNEYREEPEDKKKRKKKKKGSLEGGLQVDLKGPSVELGRIYSFINRFSVADPGGPPARTPLLWTKFF